MITTGETEFVIKKKKKKPSLQTKVQDWRASLENSTKHTKKDLSDPSQTLLKE